MTDHLPRLQEEYARALRKHPAVEWAEASQRDMRRWMIAEVSELFVAMMDNDLSGPHGIETEATQVAIVAMRIIEEMRKRHEAADN